LLLALAALLSGPVAIHAASCEPDTDPEDCLLIPDGADSDDVSPYCFLPTLPRGQNPAHYAVTLFDDDGVCHHFETFLRFELPSTLLVPGETVTAAFLDVAYAFSFSRDGPPPEPPHAPVTLRVHLVTSPWTENGVSWNLRPAYETTPIDSFSEIVTFSHVVFDVTDVVRAWAHGTAANHGFVLTGPGEHALGFHSWEASVSDDDKAALLIVRGPGTPPAACGDVDVDADVDGVDVARFRRALADPAGQALGAAGTSRCNVLEAGEPCSLRDVAVLARSLVQPSLAPGVAPVCSAVSGP
jgi:hypothetical protein